MFKTFLQGFETALENRRLLLLLYLTILLFSAVLLMPYGTLVESLLPTRGAAESFLGTPDYVTFSEIRLLDTWDGFMEASRIATVGGILLFSLFLLLLKGGTLSILIEPARPGQWMRTFFDAGGRFFFRFFRLAILSLVVVALLLSATSAALKAGVELVTKHFDSEIVSIGMYGLMTLLLLLLFGFLTMVADFARIETVLHKEKTMLRSYTRAWRFALSKPLRLYGVVLLYHLLSLLLLWAALFVHLHIGQRTSFTWILVVVLNQVWVALRVLLWVGLYATELECYDARE